MTAEWLLSPFAEYEFMRRALAGCLAVALGATPLGTFLVLRRMSLTGDAMAHAILPGAAVGYLFAGLSLTAMTFGGMLAGMTVALLTSWISRRTEHREDASLAALYLISLAAGVAIISMSGSNLDLLHVLFGSVLALNDEALILLASIASVSILSLSLLYRPLVMECCDPKFLRTVSNSAGYVHAVFLLLIVLNLVAGFHALGTLMAVGLMVLPAVAARFWAADISRLILVATAMAVFSCFAGLLLSFHYGMPTGSAIILTCGALYLLSVLFGVYGGVLSTVRPGERREA